MRQKKIIITFIVIVIVTSWFVFHNRPRALTRAIEQITVDDVTYTVWVADDPSERRSGLSGVTIDDLDAHGVDGMLFVFDEPAVQKFWMRGMEFDLDFVWMLDGEVVKIDEDVPAPVNNRGDTAIVSSDPYKVDTVLELHPRLNL